MARARITLSIGGKKRLLKYTMSTLKRYDDSVQKEGAALTLLMANPMSALLALTLFAMVYDGNENDLPENLTEDDVAEWIDDLSAPDMKRVVNAMMLTVKKFGDAFSTTPQESVLKKTA